MKERIYKENYEAIIHMIHKLGMDATNTHLLEEIHDAKKEVAILREKIGDMKNSIQYKSNTDVLIHLEYDIEDANILLNQLLQNLKKNNEKYICFQEYLKKTNFNNQQ